MCICSIRTIISLCLYFYVIYSKFYGSPFSSGHRVSCKLHGVLMWIDFIPLPNNNSILITVVNVDHSSTFLSTEGVVFNIKPLASSTLYVICLIPIRYFLVPYSTYYRPIQYIIRPCLVPLYTYWTLFYYHGCFPSCSSQSGFIPDI